MKFKLKMKSILVFLLVFSAGFFLWVPAKSQAGDLKVVVKNARSNKGKVWIALSNSESDYNQKESAFKKADVSIENNTGIYTFEDLPYGVYAIKVFHDENANDVLDKNVFGLPKERYGFSNDASAMGVPGFEKTSFTINQKKKEVIIRLK